MIKEGVSRMSDLIDRQAAIDFIDAGRLCNPNEPRWSDNEIVNFLKSRPSAQRTGRWIEDSGNIACSECHIIWLHRRTAFCPNCGARMEVKE